jgi:hypothetical protein
MQSAMRVMETCIIRSSLSLSLNLDKFDAKNASLWTTQFSDTQLIKGIG